MRHRVLPMSKSETNFGSCFCDYISCFKPSTFFLTRSQWPRGLRRGSTTARLLGERDWIPLGARMSVSCECCMLLVRGLRVGLITSPEESCRVWRVWVWSWSLGNEEYLTQYELPRNGKNICIWFSCCKIKPLAVCKFVVCGFRFPSKYSCLAYNTESVSSKLVLREMGASLWA